MNNEAAVMSCEILEILAMIEFSSNIAFQDQFQMLWGNIYTLASPAIASLVNGDIPPSKAVRQIPKQIIYCKLKVTEILHQENAETSRDCPRTHKYD